jgi:hypothetical protein
MGKIARDWIQSQKRNSYPKNTNYSATIPHPLLFESPRNAQSTRGFSLTENVIYLNILFSALFSNFSLDFFAGPAYFFANAEFIDDIQYSDSYPYEVISINASTKTIDKNVLGFNGGASFNFYFANNFGIFINAQYLSASTDFSPGDNIPGWKVSLGGLKAGGGLKLIF